MKTLLEFLLTEYLGRPTRTLGNGVSYWPCPVCQSTKFRSLPVHPVHKHRAMCHKCGLMEDAAGLLREFHSGAFPDWAKLTNYCDRVDLLDRIEREWHGTEKRPRS